MKGKFEGFEYRESTDSPYDGFLVNWFGKKGTSNYLTVCIFFNVDSTPAPHFIIPKMVYDFYGEVEFIERKDNSPTKDSPDNAGGWLVYVAITNIATFELNMK